MRDFLSISIIDLKYFFYRVYKKINLLSMKEIEARNLIYVHRGYKYVYDSTLVVEVRNKRSLEKGTLFHFNKP